MFAALDAFVNDGGNVLAFNTASTAMIDGLKLPVKNVLAGVRNTDFYAPGSILGVEIKRDHPDRARLHGDGSGRLVRERPGIRDL